MIPEQIWIIYKYLYHIMTLLTVCKPPCIVLVFNYLYCGLGLWKRYNAGNNLRKKIARRRKKEEEVDNGKKYCYSTVYLRWFFLPFSCPVRMLIRTCWNHWRKSCKKIGQNHFQMIPNNPDRKLNFILLLQESLTLSSFGNIRKIYGIGGNDLRKCKKFGFA